MPLLRLRSIDTVIDRRRVSHEGFASAAVTDTHLVKAGANCGAGGRDHSVPNIDPIGYVQLFYGDPIRQHLDHS